MQTILAGINKNNKKKNKNKTLITISCHIYVRCPETSRTYPMPFDNNNIIQRLIFSESQFYHKVQKVEEG